MDTKRSLEEIEVALANDDRFHYLKNIVVFNVTGAGQSLLIPHECDMLVLNKSGYLTEIEIKRSFSDFKKDFQKKHKHDTSLLIKHFYFCIPKSIEEKAIDYMEQMGRVEDVITYDENLSLSIRKLSKSYWRRSRKLFLEERLMLATYGTRRVISLKKKLIKR